MHAGDDPDVPDASRAHGRRCWPRSASPPAKEILDSYPHQLSGGQQQRIALAMAFSCRPELIVLDEPTTGLDVATQRHVLDTVRGLCSSYGVAARLRDPRPGGRRRDRRPRGGHVRGPAHRARHRRRPSSSRPRHPYTDGLLKAIPSPEICHVLVGMEGQPPSPGRRPAGLPLRAALPARHRRLRGGADRRWSPVNGDAHQARCIRAKELVLASTGVEQLAASAPRCRRRARGRAAPRGRGPRRALRGQADPVRRRARPCRDASCVAVVGESGSGKTTLARCVTGLHGNWTGQCAFDGQRAEAAGARTATSTCCARCSTSSRTRTRR